MNWFRLMLTEADNATPSIFRALTFLLSVHITVLASWQVFVMGQALDFGNYAMGLAALWAGAGLGERVAGPHQENTDADVG